MNDPHDIDETDFDAPRGVGRVARAILHACILKLADEGDLP
jgi:hypothetical protein